MREHPPKFPIGVLFRKMIFDCSTLVKLTQDNMVVRFVIIIVLISYGNCLRAQDSLIYNDEDMAMDNDLLYEHRLCKLPELVLITVPVRVVRLAGNGLPNSKKHLVTASGELSYHHFERNGASDDLLLINSASDIVELRLALLYKDVYPFTFSVRYNHSRPFQMDNQYEVNIGFDERLFRQKMKEKLNNYVKNDYLKKQLALKDQYQQSFKSLQEQKQLLTNPRYIQEAVESRIKKIIVPNEGIPSADIPTPNHKFDQVGQWLEKIPGVSNLQNAKQRIEDSINNVREKLNWEEAQKKLHAKLEEKKDSLEKKVKKIEDSLAFYKKQFDAKKDSINKEVGEIKSAAALKKYADEKGLRDSIKTSRLAGMLMKTTIRFGKFLLNNSELTVNNIFLSGASIRYGDEKFVMLSGGLYDFAFRRVFNFRNDSFPRNKQVVFALKVGKQNGDNLSAFNVYLGRKSKSGYYNEELRTVAGISVEKKIVFNRNLSLDFEIAKSTIRPNNQFSKSEGPLKDIFTHYSTRTIGMYASGNAYLPKTSTAISVSYRYWGQQFESFNASQYFNPQNNLAGKVSQPFFKRKLYLVTGIRYTDFSTYGIASNVKTKVWFASANLTLRLKKFPIISAGFYPGSQLYWMDQNKLYEYIYYIFNTTASYYFHVGKMPVQMVFTWNRFYNKYTDTLIQSAQSYYNFFVTAWKNRFSYNMNFSRQELENNLLNTVEGGLTYSGDVFKIGGSLKGNFNKEFSRMGYSFIGGIVLKKFGTINLIYDKSFLPERTGRFIPVSTGQVQIIKPLKFAL